MSFCEYFFEFCMQKVSFELKLFQTGFTSNHDLVLQSNNYILVYKIQVKVQYVHSTIHKFNYNTQISV